MPDISVQDLIRQEATKAGIPPEFALAVAEQESGFNPGATGKKLPSGEQAVGTMQLLPSTAKTLGVDASDPVQNIRGGVQYLRQLLDQYKGDPSQALKAYGGVKTDETYVPQVLGRLKKFTTQKPAQDLGSLKTGAEVPKYLKSSAVEAPPSLAKFPQHLVETGVAGVQRAAGGARQLVTGKGEGGRERGARDLFEGSLEATAPISVPLAAISVAVNPLETLSALGISYAGGRAGEVISKRLGASPDTAALVGDIAGFLAPEAIGPVKGAVRGALKSTGEAAAQANQLKLINQKYDLNLSKPELMPKGGVGGAARQAQRAITSTLTGGAVQSGSRAQGEQNAVAFLDRAVRTLAEPTEKETAGRAAEQGLLAAREGRGVLGQAATKAAETAPPVDLVNPLKDGTPGIQTEIEHMFAEKILPDLLDHPEGVKSPIAQRALREFAKNDDPIWDTGPLGTQTLSPQAKKVFRLLPTGKADAPFAPFTEKIKGLYFGKPSRLFTSVKKTRSQIFRSGAAGDPYFAPDEQAGLARHFAGQLTKHLHETSPEYASAASEYQGATTIIGGKDALMTKMLKEVATKPSTAVDYVGQGPEYARNFRRALLGVAAKGPNQDVAKAGFNVVRATYWRDKVMHGTEGTPDLPGMMKRIDQQAPVLRELYADTDGTTLLNAGKDIAKAYQAQTQNFQRSLYLVFVAARLFSGGSPATFLEGEAATGFLTWLMYENKYANWFIHGVQGGPEKSAAVLRRIGQAYAAHLGVVKAQQQRAALKRQPKESPQP